MVEEKSESEKYQRNPKKDSKQLDEKQILVDELRKELKKEIVNEGVFLLAIYKFFMDCDL